MKQVQLGDGVVMSFLNHSDELTVSRVEFEAGASAVVHEHPHEEVNYALEGRFEIELAGSRYLLAKGDSVRIPPHTRHSIRNLAGDAAVLSVWPGKKSTAPAEEPKTRTRAKAKA